jgi:nucleoid DNA-binding protein
MFSWMKLLIKLKIIKLRKFGRLYQKKIVGKANARNPKTGEQISTKEKISIAFKMSKELKNRINLNYKG